MLILYREIGQTFTLRLSDDIDPSTPIGEIFERRDIVVGLKSTGETTARIGIEAPRAFKVIRTELLEGDKAA